MPNDVWSALAKGCLGFAHSRVGDMTGTTFNDTGSLVTSLFDHSPLGTAKTRLDQLKRDVDSLSAAAQPVIDAVKPEVAKAKLAVGNMARELETAPFSLEAAGRAATELAYVMIALDVVAKKIAEPEPGEAARRDLENQIRGIREPWIAPFRGMAAGASAGFDALCNTVLGVDRAGTKFADLLIWSREQKKLTLTLSAAGARSIDALEADDVLSFDEASVEAFFSYKDTAKVGVVLRTRLKAGLRGDKLLAKIIPGEKPTADSESIAITLDTKDGLTFGDGPNRTLVLPVRVSLPGIELRELAIALPEGKDGRIDIMATVAGNLGDVVGVVAEGFGVSLKWKGDHGAALTAEVKPPTAAGLRIKAGVINGGGTDFRPVFEIIEGKLRVEGTPAALVESQETARSAGGKAADSQLSTFRRSPRLRGLSHRPRRQLPREGTGIPGAVVRPARNERQPQGALWRDRRG
jgi:hypothetical protein